MISEKGDASEKPDADISLHRLVDAAVGVQEPLAKDHEERCERSEDEAGYHGDREGAPEHRLLLGLVAPAECLRDQTGRPGAHEVEGGEDESKTSAPTARPPISAASPNWPTTAVSTRPSNGVVR